MDRNYAQLWQKLSAALKPQVSPDTFKRWFSAVKLVQATEDAFTFRVPNNIYQFWIESNHMAALQAASMSKPICSTSRTTAATFCSIRLGEKIFKMRCEIDPSNPRFGLQAKSRSAGTWSLHHEAA